MMWKLVARQHALVPSALVVLVAALLAAHVQAQARLESVPLRYPADAWEPAIDAQTMTFHSSVHYQGYVNNTNKLLASTGMDANLTALIMMVGSADSSLSEADARTARNQGGGAWNHAMMWKLLVPPNSTLNSRDNISPQLTTAIQAAFGSVDAMIERVSNASTGQFGSGWGWLCSTRNGTLSVTATPNQDNPLMPVVAGDRPACAPILGIDVWEHAHYLKHGPKRADWVSTFWRVLDWSKVSENYQAAQSADYASIAQ